MSREIRVIGLGGSLAENSTSRAALRIALEGARHAGASADLFDVRVMDLPMYRPGSERPPEEAVRFAEAVHRAHGLIWSSPLYHGTVSGVFKNAIDWLQLLAQRDPPYLTNKVVGLVSVAGGVQGLQAVNTMEFIVRALRGWAVPLVNPIAQAWKVFDEEGQARDERVDVQLRGLGMEVVRAARQFAAEGTCDYAIAGDPASSAAASAVIE